MSFFFTSAPAPTARVTRTAPSGFVTVLEDIIADESVWIDEFTDWATSPAGVAHAFMELDPDTAFGTPWGEIIADHVDETGDGFEDDDIDTVIGELEDHSGYLDSLDGTKLGDLAATAISNFVIQHARAAFDSDMEETAVLDGKVVTGGPSRYDDYPTDVFQSIMLLSDLDYFSDFDPIVIDTSMQNH